MASEVSQSNLLKTDTDWLLQSLALVENNTIQ